MVPLPPPAPWFPASPPSRPIRRRTAGPWHGWPDGAAAPPRGRRWTNTPAVPAPAAPSAHGGSTQQQRTARHGAAWRSLQCRPRWPTVERHGFTGGEGLGAARWEKLRGDDFKRDFTAAKERITTPQHAPRLWTHAGVGFVEHEYLLAEASRGDGRWDGGQLKVAKDAGNHRLLGEGRKAPSAHAVAEEWQQ